MNFAQDEIKIKVNDTGRIYHVFYTERDVISIVRSTMVHR